MKDTKPETQLRRWSVRIQLGSVVASSEEEARQKAAARLSYLAESNDGSEVLANAIPEVFWEE